MKLPDTLVDISDEKLVDMSEKIMAEREVLDSAISVIKNELMERLNKQNLDGKIIGRYSVSIQRRVLFTDVPLSFAKDMGAITEAIDTTALKSLYSKGVKIPNVKVSQFVSMREIKE